MKVTAILGSPRKKGDCFNVIEMLQRSFNRVEETQIDYIYLNDIELGLYWKEHGWFETEYYTNAKISIFKKIYSRFIRKIMKKLITTKLMIIR